MLTRRDTLRILGATGLAAPALTACGGADGAARTTGPVTDPAGIRLVSAHVTPSVGDPTAVAGVVRAMGGLTRDLWGHLAPADENLALSPYSVAMALAMTANGAAGPTRAQMLDVLHIGSLATYNSGAAALARSLAALAGPVRVGGARSEIDLTSVDQLFGDAGTTFGPAFLTVLAKQYGAGMRTVDFAHDVEASRAAINGWTAQQTHDRIPTILPPGSLDPSTRLVLVNALYFKAPWAAPFDKAATRQQDFHRADGSRVTVPMMRATPEGASYLTGDHWRGARLPYAGNALAMTVALPDPGHEADAVADLMAGGLTAEAHTGVDLAMPRWTFRTSSDLGEPLMDLGMTRAFGEGSADFSPMSPGLYVDAVLHQAFIAVDEAGTEAAAATAVVMDEASAIAAVQTLVLDRPFLFVIHDTAQGTPLFVGRVADPS